MNILGLKRHIHRQNRLKPVFTPGPGSINIENIFGLGPAFGRGDLKFQSQKLIVENWLKELTGKQRILTFQGSGSMSCEIAINTFLKGRILVINTGFYSDRLFKMASTRSDLDSIQYATLNEVANLQGTFDWIVSCSVETSIAYKINISSLKNYANKFKSKLLVDATASIGLEDDHSLADVLCFSSCKGLFGLTGAGFIAFEDIPTLKNKTSFYMDFDTHLNNMVTGPYHAIQSLVNIIPYHHEMRYAVKINKDKFVKKFINQLPHELQSQPMIATLVNCKLTSKNSDAVLYLPRKPTQGSVISHLGETYLKYKAKGKLVDLLELES
jgi:aspartate aminotransferase-like enzyme